MASIDIIVNLIDRASQQFANLAKNSEGAMNSMKRTVVGTGASFEGLTRDINRTTQTLESVSPDSMNRLSDAAMNTTGSMEALTLKAGASADALKGVGETSQSFDAVGSSAIIAGQSIGQNFTNSIHEGKLSLMRMVEAGAVFDAIKEAASRAGQGITGALDVAYTKLGNLRQKAENFKNSLGKVGQMFSTAFGLIGVGSLYEVTIGLAMSREQMNALMTATTGSEEEAKRLMNTLDEMTNQSIVGLTELGNAINTIGMMTGMTTAELEGIAPVVNDIGQAAILMGADAQYAQDLMVASARGLNGEFVMLQRNFGITREALMELGWSGAADDVEGYYNAINAYLEQSFDLDGVMETTTGQIEILRKQFRIAGRQVGDEFIPHIMRVVEWLINLNEVSPVFFRLAIWIGGVISVIALLIPVIDHVIGAFQKMVGAIQWVTRNVNLSNIALIKNKIIKIKNAAATKLSTVAEFLRGKATTVSSGATKAHTAMLGAHNKVTALATKKTGLHTVSMIKKKGVITLLTGKLGAMKVMLGGLAVKMAIATGGLALVAGAVYYLATQTDIFASNAAKMIGELSRLENQTMTWHNAVENTNSQVERLRRELGELEKGTPEYIKTKEALTKAETDHAIATENLAKAKELEARYAEALAQRNVELAQMYGDLETAQANALRNMGAISEETYQNMIKDIDGLIDANYHYLLIDSMRRARIKEGIVGYEAYTTALRDGEEATLDFNDGLYYQLGHFDRLRDQWGPVNAMMEKGNWWLAHLVINTFNLNGVNSDLVISLSSIYDIVAGTISKIVGLSDGYRAYEGLAILAGGASDRLASAIEWVEDAVEGLRDKIPGFRKELEESSPIIDTLVGFLGNLVGIFYGNSPGVIPAFRDAGEAAQDWLNIMGNLPGELRNILGNTLTNFTGWAGNIVSSARETGRNTLGRLMDNVRLIPGRVSGQLTNTLNNTIRWGGNIVSRASGIGSDTTNRFIGQVSTLPGSVATEFSRIATAMANTAGNLYRTAVNIGSGIVSNLKRAMGISSPGDIYYMVKEELESVEDLFEKNKIVDNVKGLGRDISRAASGISMDVGVTASATMSTDIHDLAAPVISTTATMDTDMPDMDTGGYSHFYDIEALDTQTTDVESGLNKVNDITGSAFNRMYDTVDKTMHNLVDVNKKSYEDMNRTMDGNLRNMNTTNQRSMDTINRTIHRTMDSVRDKTTSEIGNVRNSWQGMQSALINSSAEIQRQVTNHINTLRSNMARFWSAIQNPGRLLAGPMPKRARSAYNRVVNTKPPSLNLGGYAGSPVSSSGVNRRGLWAGGGSTRWNIPDFDERTSKMLLNTHDRDICPEGMDCYAAWSYHNRWIPDIKRRINDWRVSFPYDMNLRVGDFEDTWNPFYGNLDAFSNLVLSIIGGTRYGFYYNSRFGSPGAALQAGRFNCYDGALIVMALANAFGLPNHMVYGRWNGIGHVWANVAGRNIDTTAIQFGYGLFAPSRASRRAGPAEFVGGEAGSFDVDVKQDVNLNVRVDFRGAPKGFDEEMAADLLEERITDSKLVNKLAGSKDFLRKMSIGLYKRKRSYDRSGGE